jgi:NAD(P)H dehydrogenase (quinone)
MANDARFLVTGAGGMVGATGNHAVRQLLEKRLPVRALVHRADERSDRLRSLGAEIVVGDLRDFDTVSRAMRDVRAAYFTYPLDHDLLEATTIFAAAARDARVEAIVNMSQITARPDHPSPASRLHWLAERILDWSGVGATHLRPPFFLENLIPFAAQTIRSEGKIYLPFGEGRHAPVAGEDLARVVVGVLVDPAPHRGRTYVPTGPRSLSIAEMATTFSQVLGKAVQYVDLPVERWRQVLAKLPGVSPHMIDHLSRVAEAHQRGEFDAVTDDVWTVGGAQPKSLDAFIAEHRAAFAAAA